MNRHTVRTWLATCGVPDAEADEFTGRREEGSATGRGYKRRCPEYLRTVKDAISALYDTLER